MEELDLDLESLFSSLRVRSTARWIYEATRVSFELRRLAVREIYLFLVSYGLAAIGVVLLILAALGWLPSALPTTVLAVALGFYLGNKYYCRKAMAKLAEQGDRLHQEKEEKLTAIGLLRFGDAPGYHLAIAQGKGGFHIWQWGTEAELQAALAEKLKGRLLRIEVPAAVCSHSRFAVLAAGHVASELAGLVDEREAISLPPVAFQEIAWTAQMMNCPSTPRS